jgi:tRNA(Ile2) C34 agmatinyltransferase TiaS
MDTVCEQCGNRLQSKQAYRSCLQCYQEHRAATDSDSDTDTHG